METRSFCVSRLVESLNQPRLAGYSFWQSLSSPKEVKHLTRFRSLLLLLVIALVGAVSPRLFGKGSPCDILIQSTTDVYGEVAPCG